MVESASQDFTDHILLVLPTTLSPFLTALLLHRRIYPPWNPIILCISWVAGDNSGTPQLTKTTLLTLNPISSVIFFLSYSWFYHIPFLNRQISKPSSFSITEQGELSTVQSVFIWGKESAKGNSGDTPGSKAMTPDPTASSSNWKTFYLPTKRMKNI